MADVSVPTIRTDIRTQRVLLLVLLADLVVIGHGLTTPWLLAVIAFGVLAIAVFTWATRRTSRDRPPVTATPQGLRLPDPDGHMVEIAWPDIATVTYRRRMLLPHLIVVPRTADDVRPAPNPWQRAATTGHDGYRLMVALGGNQAARTTLRQTITTHLGCG